MLKLEPNLVRNSAELDMRSPAEAVKVQGWATIISNLKIIRIHSDEANRKLEMSLDTPPLSPHLQVYRLPITALLSISHRLTGVFLAFGTLLLFYVLVAAAAGPQAYQEAHEFVASWFGQLLLFLFTFALYFHFCNGIRHLIWDVGHGFELETMDKSAYAVLGISIVLTLITWGIAIVSKGGGA